MRAVLGIGNPGKKYEDTRHNIGFFILDKLAEKNKLSFQASKGEYYIAGSVNNASPFFLIKPTTYVNLSGIAALDFIDAHDIDLKDLLIITDDINLEPGKIRIRKSGGDGGHNGIASLIYHLHSDQFPRLRFGIGSDFNKGQMAEFVLDKFSPDDLKYINPAVESSIDIIEKFIEGGIDSALNYFSKVNQQSISISKINNNEGN